MNALTLCVIGMGLAFYMGGVICAYCLYEDGAPERWVGALTWPLLFVFLGALVPALWLVSALGGLRK